VNTASLLKGLGYLVSTLSVALLGIVSWKAASENPLLLACLIAGMASSVFGMCLRFASHRIEQREKQDEAPKDARDETPRVSLARTGSAL